MCQHTVPFGSSASEVSSTILRLGDSLERIAGLEKPFRLAVRVWRSARKQMKIGKG
jgi:hypothetical protein